MWVGWAGGGIGRSKNHHVYMTSRPTKNVFASGLTLKPSQCVIVPLAPFSNEVKFNIKTWLFYYLHSWRNFDIRLFAKYLGIMFGPSAKAHSSQAPFHECGGGTYEICCEVSLGLGNLVILHCDTVEA